LLAVGEAVAPAAGATAGDEANDGCTVVPAAGADVEIRAGATLGPLITDTGEATLGNAAVGKFGARVPPAAVGDAVG
jgi:hypothetical protein